MYMYDYYLKDGSRKVFYTDESDIPEELLEFVEEHENEIDDKFCDHFPMTVKEFFRETELEDCDVICK